MKDKNKMSEIIYNLHQLSEVIKDKMVTEDIAEFLSRANGCINSIEQELLKISENAILNGKILYEQEYYKILNKDYSYDFSDDYDYDFKIFYKLFDEDTNKKIPNLGFRQDNTKILTNHYINLFENWFMSRNEFDFKFYGNKYIERQTKLLNYLSIKEEYEYYRKVKEKFDKFDKQLGKLYAIEGLHCFDTESSCFDLHEFKEWFYTAKKLAPDEKDVLNLENCILKAKISDLEYKLDECREDEIDENYRPVSYVAKDILNDWDNVNKYAKPYLNAMLKLNSNQESYGQDSITSVISYFLANSSSYVTEKSNEYKRELRNLLKIYNKK